MKFGIWKLQQRQGIALLLTVFLLTAILSIGIGVFNVLYGELLITGAMEDSFHAINGSDHGVERTLYRDRVIGPLPNGSTENDYPLLSGACYDMGVTKVGVLTQIQVTAEYRCNVGTRSVRRAFRVTY
ncbi:MAG: hypothetical protein HYT98_01505 [Candidatus Sungbacteria bacterium]|nr:hypothetical protein [Candidatus Sungbacteria bacterium]